MQVFESEGARPVTVGLLSYARRTRTVIRDVQAVDAWHRRHSVQDGPACPSVVTAPVTDQD